jgi:hypothetical protein
VVLYSGQFPISGGEIPAFYSHETHPLREKDVKESLREREGKLSKIITFFSVEKYAFTCFTQIHTFSPTLSVSFFLLISVFSSCINGNKLPSHF